MGRIIFSWRGRSAQIRRTSDLDAELATLIDERDEWIRHYPVVEHSWTIGEDDIDGPGREAVVCGCDSRFGYKFGEGIHV